MKLHYKSPSFEVGMDYDDSQLSSRTWLDMYDKQLKTLLDLSKADAEAMTRQQCLCNIQKAKELGI